MTTVHEDSIATATLDNDELNDEHSLNSVRLLIDKNSMNCTKNDIGVQNWKILLKNLSTLSQEQYLSAKLVRQGCNIVDIRGVPSAEYRANIFQQSQNKFR